MRNTIFGKNENKRIGYIPHGNIHEINTWKCPIQTQYGEAIIFLYLLFILESHQYSNNCLFSEVIQYSHQCVITSKIIVVYRGLLWLNNCSMLNIVRRCYHGGITENGPGGQRIQKNIIYNIYIYYLIKRSVTQKDAVTPPPPHTHTHTHSCKLTWHIAIVISIYFTACTVKIRTSAQCHRTDFFIHNPCAL